MAPAIQIEGLSKRYRLQSRQQSSYRTLRETLADVGAATLQRLLPGRAAPTAGADDFWALRDVSFEVQPGEVVGIIGRNGAGKSTLLKILSRITEPTSGRAVLRGRVASLLEVGTGFHPELSGRENIYLNGSILGMKRHEIQRKFDEIVDFSGVEKFLETPVKRYSSGMYVRLAFAVAAHLDPEILIIDEVLAVGDVEFQSKCLGKMRDAARSGKTVLFVSHNLASVQQLTSKCVLLHEGRVRTQGQTDQVVANYLSDRNSLQKQHYDVRHALRSSVSYTEDARFESVAFPTPSSSLIGSDEPLEFIATVLPHKNADDVRFSMTVFTHAGTPVGSAFTSTLHSLRADQLSSFRIALHRHHLAPGNYHIGMALGHGVHRTGHRDFDVIYDVLHFQVRPESGVASTCAYWTPGWGNIHFPGLVSSDLKD
jgi:lipopolysaccharide transport system ATP-binding protein